MLIGIDASRAFVKERTGTENYSWEMIKALAALKTSHQFILYTRPIVDSSLLIPDLPENFSIVTINRGKLWTQFGLALQAWSDKLDVLWVPAHTLPVFAPWWLPMVVTIHGIEYQHLPGAYSWGQNWHLTWSTRWAAVRANRIIAVSSKTSEDLISWLKTKKEKVHVIHEGVDLEKFAPAVLKKTLGLRNSQEEKLHVDEIAVPSESLLRKVTLDKPYILFVGTVQPRKNLSRLIEAFALLKQDIVRTENLSLHRQSHVVGRQQRKSKNVSPDVKTSMLLSRKLEAFRDLELIIAGKLGWDYDGILSSPQRLGIADSVHFLGYVDDAILPELYRNALIYVEPSLQEGFGLPVLEAMASGVPVVAANAGALPEIVGDAGILVDPLRADSLKIGLEIALTGEIQKNLGVFVPADIADKQDARQVLLEKGKTQIKKFSWEAAAQKLMKDFELIGSRN